MPFAEKVDIWSLGVSVVTRLTGEFPYSMERGQVAIECIQMGIEGLNGHPGLNGVSEACKHLLSQMLQMDPDARVSAAEALNHPWFMMSDSEEDLAAKAVGRRGCDG
jgi:calcium-dependent protein kinase